MKKLAACPNCESGRLQPGQYGKICDCCDTFFPAAALEPLVDIYFAVREQQNDYAASVIGYCLSHYFQLTQESMRWNNS